MTVITKNFIRKDLRLTPDYQYNPNGSGHILWSDKTGRPAPKKWADREYDYYNYCLWLVENCEFDVLFYCSADNNPFDQATESGFFRIDYKTKNGTEVKGKTSFSIPRTIKQIDSATLTYVSQFHNIIYDLLKQHATTFIE